MKYMLVYKPSLLFLDLLRETRLDFYQGPSRSSTSSLVHEHVFLPHKVSTFVIPNRVFICYWRKHHCLRWIPCPLPLTYYPLPLIPCFSAGTQLAFISADLLWNEATIHREWWNALSLNWGGSVERAGWGSSSTLMTYVLEISKHTLPFYLWINWGLQTLNDLSKLS